MNRRILVQFFLHMMESAAGVFHAVLAIGRLAVRRLTVSGLTAMSVLAGRSGRSGSFQDRTGDQTGISQAVGGLCL